MRLIMNLAILPLVIVLVSGCATGGTSSSSATLPVEIINDKKAEDCEFVGVSTGHNISAFQPASDNVEDARMKAAQSAYESGADSAVIKSVDVESPGHNATVNMDTYKCESAEKDN